MTDPLGRGAAPVSPGAVFARRDWVITALGLALALALLLGGGFHGGAPPGGTTSFVVTVVAPDATGLDCAGEAIAGEASRCGFDVEHRPVPMARPLHPFVTVGSELVLLAGVFEEEHVAAWLRDAVARHSPERVTLDCTGPWLGHSGVVAVRFGAASAWQTQRDVTVGRVERCRVQR